MRVRLADHAVQETHVVGQRAEVRDQVGNHLARLATRLEFPGAACEHALFALKRNQAIGPWHLLSMSSDQCRLVVKRIELAAGSRTENHEHVFGTGREMWLTSRKWSRRIDQRTNRLLVTDASLFRRQGLITLQQLGERHTA